MTPHPTRRQAKELARALRQHAGRRGETISHGAALDRVARAHGFRDWNGLSAHAGDDRREGAVVTGSYLGQPFRGRILQSRTMRPGWTRLVLDLDKAVDVVTSDSFSNLRKRITATVGPRGHTQEVTSDGRPHLILTP
ncbi:glyoxalase superfamily protein [Jannaschia sp. 2305UL9-9]|uniref:glyoxalase superfamily protein n=1 Tax=Jannaschia sp. 2305UL9-9 TaxID=3121638 RepID=UPI0035273E4B